MIQEAFVVAVLPPPVRGIGTAGGFRMMVEDRAGQGPAALREAAEALMARAAQTPGLSQVFTLFETSTPEVYLNIDRTKAQLLGVNVQDVFNALQIYIGSSYVNDFNLFGRTFRVTAQARDEDRHECQRRAEDPRAQFQRRHGAARLLHHRGQHLRARIACRTTIFIPPPSSMAPPRPAIRRARRSRSWTSSRPRRCRRASPPNGRRSPFSRSGPATRRCSPSCWRWCSCSWCWRRNIESLTLPLAVIMIVPMCLVAAITGVILRGQDNNILTQVGFVVLIGLAAKNAILIVEFARQLEDQGRSRWDAAVEATRLRLRPILMTSFAFILGVTPLVWAIGAGAELRQALGTAVFFGMIGVTAFGLIFTPVFYVIARWIAQVGSRRGKGKREPGTVPRSPGGWRGISSRRKHGVG